MKVSLGLWNKDVIDVVEDDKLDTDLYTFEILSEGLIAHLLAVFEKSPCLVDDVVVR